MKINKIILALFALSIFVTSCKKKFDLPSSPASPAVSSYITIDSIIKRYGVYYVPPAPTPTKLYRFTGDVNLKCTVTADETSGNIYKTVFVEDSTGSALTLKLINSGGLLVGDKIRINLNNVVLNDYGGMVQLDSIDIEKRVVKLSSGNTVTPTKMTFSQITSTTSIGLGKYQSKLVILDSVEFAAGDKSQTYADAINKFSIDRTLINSNGGSVVVRNSGYANFAGSIIPCGKGSIVAIVGEYNGTTQLTVRDFKEIKLASGGCPILVKAFNDGSATSGNWTNYNVSGIINWVGGTYGGQNYGEISNFTTGNQPCETWLISPAFNISTGINPRFSFQSAYKYTGPTLEVWVSTNYVSGAPSTATWTQLTGFTLSPGNFTWANSGNISLSAYMSPNTRIAFKYTGTSTSGSRWEIDDIAVFAD